jgi:hypothetical protein
MFGAPRLFPRPLPPLGPLGPWPAARWPPPPHPPPPPPPPPGQVPPFVSFLRQGVENPPYEAARDMGALKRLLAEKLEDYASEPGARPLVRAAGCGVAHGWPPRARAGAKGLLSAAFDLPGPSPGLPGGCDNHSNAGHPHWLPCMTQELVRWTMCS